VLTLSTSASASQTLAETLMYIFTVSFFESRFVTVLLSTFLCSRSLKDVSVRWDVFWATVASNGSPYATGPLFCLSCLSVTLVYCGQTVGWIKMPLGTEVGLGAGDMVLDGEPAPFPALLSHVL